MKLRVSMKGGGYHDTDTVEIERLEICGTPPRHAGDGFDHGATAASSINVSRFNARWTMRAHRNVAGMRGSVDGWRIEVGKARADAIRSPKAVSICNQVQRATR